LNLIRNFFSFSRQWIWWSWRRLPARSGSWSCGLLFSCVSTLGKTFNPVIIILIQFNDRKHFWNKQITYITRICSIVTYLRISRYLVCVHMNLRLEKCKKSSLS
jgi:hypothetical protein